MREMAVFTPVIGAGYNAATGVVGFGNLSSLINNHLTVGYVCQPSARRAANPHHERATTRAYHNRVKGLLISGLVITGEACGFDFEQEQ
jgi:hypothetical protein